MGPGKIQQGDELYVLRGGRTPFILRKVGARTIVRGR